MDTNRLKMLASELKRQQSMEKSFNLARKRQQHMLPKTPKFPGYTFAAIYRPAENISGDFYDFIEVSPNETGLALGDVSGHGIEAGIIMGMAKKALEILAVGVSSPRDALAKANKSLVKDLGDSTFVAASYAIVDRTQHSLRFARAGNNAPLLVNPKRAQPITVLKTRGIVIGLDKSGMKFPVLVEEQTLPLYSGDIFFQYTDGVVEAHNRAKEPFGEQRLNDILLRYANGPLEGLIEHVVQAVSVHMAGLPQEDDITLIAMKVD